jgi:hypothetical protein
MRMIRDPKGRFPERPYYTNDELDRECEREAAPKMTGQFLTLM